MARGLRPRPSPARTAAGAPETPLAPTPSLRPLGWADPAKGLAIAMVVAFHATLYLQSIGVDALLGRAKVLLELFPMPVFFLIAGMAAAQHRRMPFPAFWWRRAFPLLYLYLLWSVLRTLFYVLVPHLNGELGELPATDPLVLPLLMFWPSSSYWFLYALLIFTVVRWVIAPVRPWVQLVGAGAISCAFTSGIIETPNLGWNRVGALFVFFVAGAVLARPIKAAVTRARPVHMAVLVAALIAVTVLLVLGLRGLPPIVLVGQVAAVMIGVVACSWLPGGRVRDLLTALGRNSLRIYLLHLYLIVPAVAVLAVIAGEVRGTPAIALQAGLAFVAAVGSYFLARATGRLRWLYAPPTWMLPQRSAR